LSNVGLHRPQALARCLDMRVKIGGAVGEVAIRIVVERRAQRLLLASEVIRRVERPGDDVGDLRLLDRRLVLLRGAYRRMSVHSVAWSVCICRFVLSIVLPHILSALKQQRLN
jgi:hypothetical protein